MIFMMTVQEYFANGFTIFTRSALGAFPTIFEEPGPDAELLNHMFLHKYAHTIINEPIEMMIHASVVMSIAQQQKFLEGVRKALDFDYNPIKKSLTVDTLEFAGRRDETVKTGGHNLTRSGAVKDESQQGITYETKTEEGVYNSSSAKMSSIVTQKPNTGKNTNTTTYDNYQENFSYNGETDTSTKTGSEIRTIDSYDLTPEAIDTLYKSKMINLYDIILRSVFDDICVPIYDFDGLFVDNSQWHSSINNENTNNNTSQGDQGQENTEGSAGGTEGGETGGTEGGGGSGGGENFDDIF